MNSNKLPMAVRAFPVPLVKDEPFKPNRKGKIKRGQSWPKLILVVDTETTIDKTQRLTFGSYRYCRVARYEEPRLECVEEGLIYADDLPTRDPVEFAVLQEYVRTRRAEVVGDVPPELMLRSRRAFLSRVFHRVAYKTQALVVGFNLPFDLSRLASGWGEARGRFAGGFSLIMHEYESRSRQWRENSYRQRVAIKTIDSKRSLMGFTKARETLEDQVGDTNAKDIFRGHFLDLHTLTFALTNEGHSLASACKVFGVKHGKIEAVEHGVIRPDYVDYNRRDVKATAELLEKLWTEYQKHPISLQPTLAYSPASIGKAYLESMGVRPILLRQADFPKEVLGYAMSAYFGGRAECRIRRMPMPVVYLDFVSMYPTVNSLMGVWDFLTADHITIDDATEDIKDFLIHVSIEDLFNPETWQRLPVLVEVEPEGDILPVRARYGNAQDWQIGVNPLTSHTPLRYALPDVVAAKLLHPQGKAPIVRRALRLVPQGKQAGLREVMLRGAVSVDPRSQDFFRTVIEERQRVTAGASLPGVDPDALQKFLKVLANSASYGIFAEQQHHEQRRKQTVTVYGLERFETRVTALEMPGAYSFPPLAAVTTAAARLMLALLECCVTEAGGSYVFCDTDSMAVVATEEDCLVRCPGGPERLEDGREAVKALSWAQVEDIRQRFARLNPYDRQAVAGSILKMEKVNYDAQSGLPTQLWCYAISAKRYTLYNLTSDGIPQLRKWSEHGLGYLLNPEDPHAEDKPKERQWIKDLWQGIVTDALGKDYIWPSWLNRPALSRFTITSPTIMRRLRKLNEGKPYGAQIKPFNFMLVAHDTSMGAKATPVAPYETDPRKWLPMPWIDLLTGKELHITSVASEVISPDTITIQSYKDVLSAYKIHPEAKSLGPDGEPCQPLTEGLLKRQSIEPLFITYIGKEGNRIEEVAAGLIRSQEDVYVAYQRSWDGVAYALSKIPILEAQRLTGLSKRELHYIRSGTVPRSRRRQREIQGNVAQWAKDKLVVSGYEEARWLNDLEGLSAYRTQREELERELEESLAELAALRDAQESDVHRHFRYWHDLTECWNRSQARTRRYRATLENPTGVRSGTFKERAVDGILDEACAELGEDFSTFTKRVCEAVHGYRPREIAGLTVQVTLVKRVLEA